MNKFLLITCIAALASAGANADTVVKVTAEDGTVNEFLLADTPTVCPVEKGIQITAGDATLVLPMDQYYTFTIDESTGISDVESPVDLVTISRNADTITINGLSDGAITTAYTVDGRQVGQVISNNGTAALELSNARGVIIISTPSKTFKILK